MTGGDKGLQGVTKDYRNFFLAGANLYNFKGTKDCSKYESSN